MWRSADQKRKPRGTQIYGNKKTAGTDGLPSEFYNVFWSDMSAILNRALNYAYETGQLSVTKRRGIYQTRP